MLLQAVGFGPGTSSATLAVPIASSTAGSLIVIAVGNGSGGAITSVIDNLGQNYSVAHAIQNDVTGTAVALYYFPNSAAGVTLITVTYAAAQTGAAIACEESQVATSSPLDGTPAGTVAAAALTWNSGPTTMTNGNDVVYGCVCSGSGAGQGFAPGPGSGFAPVNGTGLSAGHIGVSGAGDFYMQRAVTYTKGQIASFGTAATSSATVAQCAAFKATGTAPTPGLPFGPRATFRRKRGTTGGTNWGLGIREWF